MIVDCVQRWTERRASRRPAGEVIRTSAYDVEAIASATEARDFVVRHHYAASASSPPHRYGLHCRGADPDVRPTVARAHARRHAL
jgi:hypothetical protein